MSEQLQLRRNTSSNILNFTGAQGEIAYDTTNNRIVGQDGATLGGFPAAKLSEVITNTRTPVPDAAYTALTTDRLIAYTTLTAARVVSLPTAASYPTGTRLTIIDETGNCTALISITITPNGINTINGVNGSIAINTAYGQATLESNGVAGWTIVEQGYPPPSKLIAESAHGAYSAINVLESALLTLPTTGTLYTVAAPQIPANCIVLGVGLYVQSAITLTGTVGSGSPALQIGQGGNSSGNSANPSQFGTISGSSLSTPGSTNYGIIGPTGFYGVTSITLTATATAGGSPGFSASNTGKVRIAIHYLTITPPSA